MNIGKNKIANLKACIRVVAIMEHAEQIVQSFMFRFFTQQELGGEISKERYALAIQQAMYQIFDREKAKRINKFINKKNLEFHYKYKTPIEGKKGK